MNKEEILKDLNNIGFHIITDYYSTEKCDEIYNEIYSNFPVNFEHQNQNERGKDYRMVYGERYFKTANTFLNDSEILDIANTYMGKNETKKRCQVGVVEYKEGIDSCSGGGWHVDNHSRQFKAIIYLTNVDLKSGHFSIIENSRNTIKGLGTHPAIKGDLSQTRVSDENVINKNSNKIHDIVGNKGTMILVDTSNIHRGNVIKEGNRVTYTNYYFH